MRVPRLLDDCLSRRRPWPAPISCCRSLAVAVTHRYTTFDCFSMLCILLGIILRSNTSEKTGAARKKKKGMCALWFHQTVKGRLPTYGKYRNITPYPRSPELTDKKVPVERINTEVDSALPLYNTPAIWPTRRAERHLFW